MALRAKVLRTKAEKFEQKELLNLKIYPKRMSTLDEMLHNVYDIRRPKSSDYDVRRDLIRVFNEIAKELYGKSNEVPIVVEFGSFSMDIFNAKSDLDLSVNFGNGAVEISREKKIQTLRKFAKKFYALQSKGHVSGVLPITTAKVPIVKVVDCGTGVECDLSVENRDGILKSQILNIISSIDERFRKLSFLMKAWAKAQNINSSKDKTLNSLSIVLFVAFHLQTRKSPILPPFSVLLKDGSDSASVMRTCRNFMNYGRGNKETLAELFVSLLIKLSAVEKLWPKGLCASAYEGCWASKTWDSKIGSISVEDFTDRSQNVARAVGVPQVKSIYKCIELSVRHVRAFMDGQIEGSKLRELLFGCDAMTTTTLVGPTTGITDFFRNVSPRPCIPIPLESIHTKKLHVMENREERQRAMPFNAFYTERFPGMAGQAAVHSGRPGQLLIPSNSVLTKRTQPVEGWGGSWSRTPTEDWVQPQPNKRMRQDEGWGRGHAGEWAAEQQPTQGWGSVHVIHHWGGSQQPIGGGWGGTQQPIGGGRGGTQQPIGGGWDGRERTSSSSLPIWTGETQHPDSAWRERRDWETVQNVNATPGTLLFSPHLQNQVRASFVHPPQRSLPQKNHWNSTSHRRR